MHYAVLLTQVSHLLASGKMCPPLSSVWMIMYVFVAAVPLKKMMK